MNDELIETILNNILKDLVIIKEEVNSMKKSIPTKKQWNVDPKKLATEKQLIAVENMGGQIWEGMTHQDVTDQFNEINKRQSQEKTEKQDQEPEEELEEGEDKDLLPDY